MTKSVYRNRVAGSSRPLVLSIPAGAGTRDPAWGCRGAKAAG